MGEGTFERSEVDKGTLSAVLADVVDSLQADEIPFLVIGGIPSHIYGRPGATQDLDIFIKPEDKDRALESLSSSGFDTKEDERGWLYKAAKKDVLVDLIFRSEGDLYLTDEMLKRAVETEFNGVAIPLVPVEDLIIMKVVAHGEETPHYWFDALAMLINDIDWDYLVERADHGVRRVLALLLYAQSCDLRVPDAPVRELWLKAYS